VLRGRRRGEQDTVSARAAAVEVLRGKRTGVKTSDIIAGVLATDGVKLGGKTPGATISAILAVEAAKPDGMIVRVEPGVFKLAPQRRGTVSQ
jgi:HB1, ASXL, restriction endonuclease HTH domain